jgi:hypothetical protein
MKLLLILLLLAAPAAARAQDDDIVEIEAGATPTIRPDRAYILFRTSRVDGAPSIEPVLLRVPTDAEMDAYAKARREAFARAEPGLVKERESRLAQKAQREAQGGRYAGEIPPPPRIETFNFSYEGLHNVRRVDDGKPYVKSGDDRIYLAELRPGDYILYGASYGNSAVIKPALHTCMCLGTVGFATRAGVVTDLGHFFADMAHRNSKIPELSGETGLGASAVAIFAPIAATLRPARPGSVLPPLGGASVVAADYRAVGSFVDGRAGSINRLGPIPGILAYDGGRVLDVKTGTVAQGPQ